MVGEERAESSEAVAVETGAEGEEPMQTDQSEAAVLQVHVGGTGDTPQVIK